MQVLTIGVDEKTPDDYLPVRYGILKLVGAVIAVAGVIVGVLVCLFMIGVQTWTLYSWSGAFSLGVGILSGIYREQTFDIILRNVRGYSRWTYSLDYDPATLAAVIIPRGRIPVELQDTGTHTVSHAFVQALGGWFNRDGAYHRNGGWERNAEFCVSKEHSGRISVRVRGCTEHREGLYTTLHEYVSLLPLWRRYGSSFLDWRQRYLASLRDHAALAEEEARALNYAGRIVRLESELRDVKELLEAEKEKVAALAGNAENYMQFVRHAITLLFNSSRALASKEVQEARETLMKILPQNDPLHDVKPPRKERARKLVR